MQGTATTIVDALNTAFKTIATDINSIITTNLPVALGIVGAVMTITIGVKIFKRLTSKA